VTLVLEIEHLTGVAYASVGPDSDLPDWPPQPDRVFSALVASWAARGQRDPERRALEWLECQAVPDILASQALPRTAPVSFVPPNDPATGRAGNKNVVPALRGRQSRRFPAARPSDPVVRFLWSDADPDEGTLSALAGLAADTAYVGHSASLARCFFRTELPSGDLPPARAALRRVYRGRLEELRRAFESGRRPSPGELVRARAKVASNPPQSGFDGRWLLLEHVADDMPDIAGAMPDIRAAAIVAKTIRDTLLSGYDKAGLGDQIPEVVSGHAADGSPTTLPHLAIVPLAFAGFPHADGHVLGFALVPPRSSELLKDMRFLQVLGTLAPMREHDGQQRRLLDVVGKGGSFSIALSPTFEPPGRRSLGPAIYIEPARDFATITPIVLDRHLKADGRARGEEIAAQIAAACRNIGLPEPEVIVPGKHSAIEGAPSAAPSGQAPSWMRWQLPTSFASRTLTHAVMRFPEPVEGPVILGAGRHVGLGLCRPIGGPEKQP
jgi:CRISPR-associated protein Csb2